MTTYFVNCLKIDGVVYKLSNESDNCIDEIRQYTYSYMTNTYEYVQQFSEDIVNKVDTTYSYISNLGSVVTDKVDNAYSYVETSIQDFESRLSNFEATSYDSVSSYLSNLGDKVDSSYSSIISSLDNYVLKEELSSFGYITNSDIPEQLWERGKGEGSILIKDRNNIAYGTKSIAEGSNSYAFGNWSHAEGSHTYAYGLHSHVEGFVNTTYGDISHAEGQRTIAYGENSHTEGYHTYAYGESSHAEGCNTVTYNYSEHAEGVSNISHTSTSEEDINYDKEWRGTGAYTISSIGIGNNMDGRRNAFEVMQNGDIYLYGVGNYDGTNLENSYTIKGVLDNLSTEITQFNETLNNYTSKEELASYNYLTEHQSLEGYASESYVISKINEAVLAGSNNEINLDIYALKTEIPNVDNFVTRNELSSYNYLTEHQSLADYATKDMLNSYVSKSLLESCGYISQHQSLSGYATEEWVTTQINNASISGGNNNINLSIYVTKDELNSCGYLTSHQPLDSYVSKSELNSCGYLTAHQPLDSYVSKLELSNCGYLTEHQPLTDYITKLELSSLGYITSQSLNGYATESYVISKINSSQLGGGNNNINLTDYALNEDITFNIETEEEPVSLKDILYNCGILSISSSNETTYILNNIFDSTLFALGSPEDPNETNETDLVDILIEAGILEEKEATDGETNWTYFIIHTIPTGE